MPVSIPEDPAPLTFTFKNVGPIKNADLELGDLTIIAGRNNTGKTYLVYTLYGFLKTWADWYGPRVPALPHRKPATSRSRVQYPVFEQITDQVAEKGQAEVTVDPDALKRERDDAIDALTRMFSTGGIADTFSAPPEKFKSASLGVKLPVGARWPALSVEEAGYNGTLSIRYDGTTLAVTAGRPSTKPHHPIPLRLRLWQQYLRFLFPELPSDPFVLSAERFGISLFYKELDFRKSQLVDLLQKYGDSKGREDDFPFVLLGDAVSRYARPIKDNIDYTRNIPDLRRVKSEVYDHGFSNDIKKLMDGYYAASGDAIEFRSVARREHRFTIPLHLASSSARGLSDLYFFLRHVARRNHLLIIDEPESHLDTANQVLLARLLARLVEAGLKVLLTTHSDYLIKEINNLIMLSRSFNNKTRVVKKLGYTKKDCIAPERIRAYIAQAQSLVRCEIDRFGIDMPNFDETINNINNVANELSIRLAEESGD